ISPRAIPIPKMELAAELYMSFASLLAPAVLMMYMLNLFTYGQAVVAVTLPIYIASLVTSIIVFTHILREPRMPEDIKYWLSGVDG
ncbi:MAG: hypothetical protein QXW93_05310, partial [Desulfurococcaceae archaeon]